MAIQISLTPLDQYSPAELAEIAHELDQDENLALDDHARATTSNNMDDSGMFPSQIPLPFYFLHRSWRRLLLRASHAEGPAQFRARVRIHFKLLNPIS